MLRGPADPTRFRLQVGRYKERWYHDPLPACSLAPATDDSWPSITSVKKAWPKFLNKWIADSVARRAVDTWDELAALDADARFAVLAKAADNKRDAAADRGSAIHALIERLALGEPIDDIWDADVIPFVPAATKLLEDLQPEWLFSEAVLINRTIGVGGTADGGWRISGSNYLVDFKTRLKHECYDDEGAQLGGYGSADYMIVDENGTATRKALPRFDRGLIITITPDSYELHPVDLVNARSAFGVLKQFWDVQQSRNLIGKPIVLTANNTADDGGLRAEHARQRLLALVDREASVSWPIGVPTFKEVRLSQHSYTHDELVAIERSLSDAETLIEAPFPPDEPKADPARCMMMIERLKALPSDLLIVAESAAAEGHIPHLRSTLVTIRHLDSLEQVVTPLEAEAAQRAQHAIHILGDLASEPALSQLLVTMSGAGDIGHATEAHLQRLELLVTAIDSLVLAGVVNEDGSWGVQAGPKAEELMLSSTGALTRTKALAVAKQIARDNGLSNPRTFAAVLGDPMLCALVAAANQDAAA